MICCDGQYSYQPVSADRPGTVVGPPIQQYVMKLVVTDRITVAETLMQ
jgi:hypothetical protein